MATTVNVVRVLNFSSKLSRSLFSNQLKRSRYLISTTATNRNKTDASNQEQMPPKESGDEKTENLEGQQAEKEKLTTQIKKLEEELKESKDKYVRQLAEAENLRKRMMKQVDDAKIFGIQGFCKDLLEVSDILSTAVNSVPKEELKDSNPHLVNLYQGLNMTESQLMKVFNKHGLESIAPKEGDKFDPNFHEALFQVPIQSKETQVADTVAIVQKIGYKLHSRTLRPALVGVFKS